METNPYAAPRVADDEPPVRPVSNLAMASMVVAGILGAFYSFVVVAAIYEVVTASPGWSIAGYVREGSLSAIFVIICAVTIHRFKTRREHARVWLMACPLLLVIFIYPGTYAVLTFLRNIIGP